MFPPYPNYGAFGAPSIPPGEYGIEPQGSDEAFHPVEGFGSDFGPAVSAPRGQLAFFFLLGAAWGTLAGLSAMTQLWGLPMQYAQVGGLMMVVICLILHGRGPRSVLAAAGDPAGGLMYLHGFVALISAAVGVMVTAHASLIQMLFAARYAFLPVAFAAMIYARDSVPGGLAALRVGLTCSGVVVCACNLPSIKLSALVDPHFRLSTFLNANANAMVGAVTAISLFDYAISSWKRRPLRAVLLTALGALAVFIVYMSRSRTGALALVAGVLLLTLLSVRLWLGVAAVFLAIPVCFVLQRSLSDVGGSLSTTFALGEHGRDLATLTGRTELWSELIRDVWMPNLFLGAGPGAINAAENGWLQNLCEVGLLGTLPLLAVVGLAAVESVVHYRDRSVRGATAILAAGAVVSLASSQLFSFGNPASLLFLLAVAHLVGLRFRGHRNRRARSLAATDWGADQCDEPYQRHEGYF